MEDIKNKIIKIFIGSSIDELQDERNKLDLFLTKLGKRLCEKYVDRGLYINIEPVRCEDVDPAIKGDRKQDEYNDLLRNCDICVFLFFTKAGKYTLEEFDNALDAFRSSGNVAPKIYTFFKRSGEIEVEHTVTDFMKRLDKDLQHYYSVFDSIDTVKLQLLLHLSILNSDFIAVEFEDGKCYVNGKEEKDVLNASQFANNTVLKELNSELEQIEKEYYALKGKYPCEDEELNKKYRKLAERRQVLIETIEQLKRNI